MIDLTKYIGKHCVIQLRAPDAWLVVHQENDRAEIMAIKSSEGPPRMVPVPVLIGLVRSPDRGPFMTNPPDVVVEFLDENKKTLEVELNPDAILSVTVAINPEGSRIKIIGE